jgi:colanic acid/amylovoran biosynthesis glycosyltransferase
MTRDHTPLSLSGSSLELAASLRGGLLDPQRPAEVVRNPQLRRVVAIFAEPLLAPSLTFIRSQAAALDEFAPVYVSPQWASGSLEIASDRAVVLCNNPEARAVWNRLRQVPFKVFGYAPSFFKRVAEYQPVLLHAHFGPAGLTALPLARWLKVPMIVTFHGYDATLTDAEFARSHYRARVYVRKRHILQEEAELFLAVSEFLRKEMLARKFPQERILVHYIGVDTEFFRPALHISRQPVVLFVARLEEKKGCAHLIRAMREVQALLPATELVVLGDGSLRWELEQMAKTSLRKYRFLGWQSPEVVREWMNRASVLCVPSVRAASGDAEGFGMVFAEAQAMGLPVASFSSGGVPEAVLDGETGLLAAEGDWRSLAGNILLLLQNPILWRKMSEAGPSRARCLFDLATQTRKLEQIYNGVLKEADRKGRLALTLGTPANSVAPVRNNRKTLPRPSLAVVQNFCTHYTSGLFATLARRLDTRFFFYSDGGEWYWQSGHGIRSGDFPHEYLRGFWLGGTRVAPALPWKLLSCPAQAILSCIDGKFSLPVAYLAARVKRVPFLLWTGLWFRVSTPLQQRMFPLTRFLYRNADAVVAYGDHVKRYLVSEGVKPERVFVARHAIDNSFYSRAVSSDEKEAIRATLGLRPDQLVVLYLGRLEKAKGVEHLIEGFALSQLPGAVLVIAGDGSERPALEDRVRKLGLEQRVRFAGYVPVKETVPYYALASMVVLPSVTTPQGKELWGLVVNEAFNQGVPVIASCAVGAVAGGLVQDGTNGIVVPETDAAALAGALERMGKDPVLRERMGAEAKRLIAEWNHEIQADSFVRAFQAALHSRMSGARGGEQKPSAPFP